MEETTQESMSVPQVELVRDDDFTTLYANNIQAEMSVWDLKVTFGILDQSVRPNKVVQHTAINLPWAQVKLITYYLQVAILLHEVQNAKIHLPQSLIPPDPSTVENPDVLLSPEAKEKLATIYRDFIASV